MKTKPKIIFFGSSHFSVEVLKALKKAGYPVLCVVTQPDKRAGRHLKLQPTAVKDFASSLSLRVLSPENLKDEMFVDSLLQLLPDLFVVVSFGAILPSEILRIPKLYPINIHASLLPKYRGAAPIQRAIINGESLSGVTIIKMNEEMDAGDIISQSGIPIDISDDTVSLEKKLADLGSKEILNVLKLVEESRVAFTKQDELQVTFAPKLKKDDGLIHWEYEANRIYNQIRGCLPWPVAFTHFKGKRLKIFSAKIMLEFNAPAKPGEIISLKDKSIFVATGKFGLKIVKLQPESSKLLSSAEFISGARLKIGDSFGD